MGSLIILLIALFVFIPTYLNAQEVCSSRAYITFSLTPTGETRDCSGAPPVAANYTGDLLASCYIQDVSGNSCYHAVTTCCDMNDVVRYSDSGDISRVEVKDVDWNKYVDNSTAKFDELKDSVVAPACAPGYTATGGGGVWSRSLPVPPVSGTAGKVDYMMLVYAEQDCQKDVLNGLTTTITLPGTDPANPGGTSGTGGTATDMTATNALLQEIKDAIVAAGGISGTTGTGTDMTETNTVLENIRIAILATGGDGTDMTATNDLITGSNDLLGQIKAQIDLASIQAQTSANGLLNGINDGIAQGQLDAAETNALLTQIKDFLAASNGGSGSTTVNVDMTTTNGLLTDAKALLTDMKDNIKALYDKVTDTGGDTGAVDAISTDGVVTEGDLTGGDLKERFKTQIEADMEYEGKVTALDMFKEHQTEWSKSELFTFVNGLKVQMGAALPVWTLSLPRWGVNYTFDLGDNRWAYVFGVIKTLIIIGATILAYKIIFRVGA